MKEGKETLKAKQCVWSEVQQPCVLIAPRGCFTDAALQKRLPSVLFKKVQECVIHFTTV